VGRLYLNSQPLSPNGWTEFFSYLDENVQIFSNLEDAPAAVGKAAAEQNLLAINTQYQNISRIDEVFEETFGDNVYASFFRKDQGSIRVGVQYGITFRHSLDFTPPPNCLVSKIQELADSGKTRESLSLEFAADPSALTCERIKWVCASHLPNFGTPNNNCMLLWQHVPNYILNDTAPGDDLTLVLPERTLSCANTILSTIVNAGPSIPDAEVAFLCSLLGAPIPNLPGCWAN